MKKFILLALYFYTISAYSATYWCPSTVVCNGIDVVSCQQSNWNDFWRLDDQHYSNVLDPYFHNTGATYNASNGLATCNYVNSDSQGLGLIPINTVLYPIFKDDFNWKWSDATHVWASCNNHDQCPFSDTELNLN